MNVASLRALPRPVAFVLPGGGVLGAYQVGVLRALAEHGVTADLLVGVSAGSLNAASAAWSRGLDGLDALERAWRSVRRRDLLRVHPGRLALAFTGRRASFLDSRHGAAWIRRTLGEWRIEDAPIRLAVVATDVTTGRAVALTDGDVVSAVVGSAAFPGVYPPVWRGGAPARGGCGPGRRGRCCVPGRVPAGVAGWAMADGWRRGRRRPPRSHRCAGRRQRRRDLRPLAR